MSSIYNRSNGISDPNSDFYKLDKREIINFTKIPRGDHTDYNFNPKVIDNTYIEKIEEHSKFTSGRDHEETGLSICSGASTNDAYRIVGDINPLEPVGRLYFTKTNIKRIQQMIKKTIYEKTNHKIILTEDQDESDLLIAMRDIYYTVARYLPEHVVHQVKQLNLKTINKFVPDMITGIKQAYGYQRDINTPRELIPRPINDNVKGRKTLPSITSTWVI